MSVRVLFLAVALFSCLQRTPSADQESITPEQIIEHYLHAIGKQQFSSITTFVERGETQVTITDPNISNLGRLSMPQPMWGHQRYENYFKAPDLRFSSIIAENNQIIDIHGCDGKVAWYIDTSLERKEFTPKPGREYSCENGFRRSLPLDHDSHTKIRLLGQKTIQGRLAWEIKVEKVKPQFPETYFFDAETYLLLRYERREFSVTFSDYREISGIKAPFSVVREDAHVKVATTVREVQVNVPIDNARFVKPQPAHGSIALNPVLSPPLDAIATVAPAATPAPPAPAAQTAGAPVPPASSTQINYPNVTTCSMVELQNWITDLRRLKPAAEQTDLQPLLAKIGAKLLDTAHNTPNLISSEAVTNLSPGIADKHGEYDYLIVPRLGKGEIYLDEFRVDVRTGEKFQIDDANPSAPEGVQATPDAIAHPGVTSKNKWQPLSQGFASSWVYFFPRNHAQSTFRYLGEDKFSGRRTVVVAFAQRPQAVTTPGLFRYKGTSVPMYFQGVAWFDPSDFQILRLHTELLSPLPGVALERLSADIQFVPTQIQGVSSILFLPRDVEVVSVVSGGTLREHHSYSNYRLFRAQSRILVD